MGPAPAGEVGSALVQSSCTGGEAQPQTSPVGQPGLLHFPGAWNNLHGTTEPGWAGRRGAARKTLCPKNPLENRSTWLAQLVQCATLDLEVVSLSPMLGVGITQKQNKTSLEEV